MKKIRISLLLLISVTFVTRSQDLHFSQYFAAPLNLNPALTGVIDGNLRLASNYRNQWYNVASFTTYGFSIDGNLFKRKLNDNILGVGASVYQDIEVKSGFTNTNIALSSAFNIKLTSRPIQYLGVGIQASMLRSQVSLNDVFFGNLYEIGQNSDPIQSEDLSAFKVDISVGISYYLARQNKYSFFIGASMFHVNRPDVGILSEDRLYRKYIAHASGEYDINRQIGLLGSIMYANQGPSNEMNIGMFVKFQPDKAENVSVYAGPMYRLAGNVDRTFGNEALIAAMRLEIYNLFLGFSYDFTISELASVNKNQGGPEVSLIVNFPFMVKKGGALIRCPKF